jgi:hypothetical protein
MPYGSASEQFLPFYGHKRAGVVAHRVTVWVFKGEGHFGWCSWNAVHHSLAYKNISV